MKGTKVILERIEEEGISPAQDAEIKSLLFEAFPDGRDSFSRTRHWHGSAPAYSVLARRAGRAVGNIAIVLRDVRCGREVLRVAGVQNLGVLPGFRGRSLGGRLLTAAMDEAQRRGIAFGLLFCVPELERFYIANGWRRIDVPVLMQYEGLTSPIPAKNIAMVRDLAGRRFPEGDIDLRGADW